MLKKKKKKEAWKEKRCLCFNMLAVMTGSNTTAALLTGLWPLPMKSVWAVYFWWCAKQAQSPSFPHKAAHTPFRQNGFIVINPICASVVASLPGKKKGLKHITTSYYITNWLQSSADEALNGFAPMHLADILKQCNPSQARTCFSCIPSETYR